MRKVYSLILVYFLVSTLFFTSAKADSNVTDFKVNSADKYEEAYRYNVNGWIYLYIEGEPHERGFQHGYLLAPEIIDMMTRWSNVIHNGPIINMFASTESSNYNQVSEAWWNYCRRGIERQFWDRYNDECKKEVEGIADGVNERGMKFRDREVDYLDILCLNEMYEFMTRFDNYRKGFHPLKELYSILRDLIPNIGDEDKFVNSFLNAPPAHHCSGFIATGNSTKDGEIVVSQQVLCGGWWYPYYIPQRWNVIIDLNPTEGNRFQMAAGPGYIWSNENYYQNEKGICIIDTTAPQGLWDRKGGKPMAIRYRNAAQYSDSIDEALHYLLDGNDGIWTAVYLIGDTKTGEIARLDLGLYKYQVWRTFDGYFWSANNLKSEDVRAESYGLALKGKFYRLLSLFLGTSGYEYYTKKYFPADRDRMLDEQGQIYNGSIDLEILKNKIMLAYPLSDDYATDLKLSDTQLMENNSLWAFFGSPGGHIWDMTDYESVLADVSSVPPMGWCLINGLPEDHDVDLSIPKYNSPSKRDKLTWDYYFADDFEGKNFWNANLVLHDDVIIGTGLDGKLYVLDSKYGDEIWSKEVNGFDGITYANTDGDIVVIGWENETCAFDLETGKQIWKNKDVNLICSKPVFVDNKILLGSRCGHIFALNLDGELEWKKNFTNDNVYLAVQDDKNTIIASIGNKCIRFDSDGNVNWEFKGEGTLNSAVAIIEDSIYFGTSDSNVYALNRKNGDLRWEQNTGWSVQNTPAVSDDTIYVGSMDNHLYAMDRKDGDILWTFGTNGAIRSTPSVYGDYVFFGSDDGYLYAVDVEEGDLGWRFAPGNTIENDVFNYITTSVSGDVIAEDHLVYMSANGMIYGLDAQTYEKPKEKSDSDNMDIPTETMLFIVLSIVIIVFITMVYLIISKKKEK